MRYARKSEDTEQMAVISWARWNAQTYPELKWLHHCPNGGSRNRLEAAKLKQMGVKAGVSDLCLPYPKGIYHGLYIEMKYGNNRVQETQREFISDMAAAGHYVCVCYSAADAIGVLAEYCHLGEVREEMGAPNMSVLKDGTVRGLKERREHSSGKEKP